METPALPKPTIKNLSLHDLHCIMSTQIRGLADGTIVPGNANAITNAAGKIISIVRLHLQYAKMTGAPIPGDAFKGPEQIQG